jgi:SAM-dependent methyltransferase
MASNLDRAFEGSIPEVYDQYLVPLIFEWYAADLAQRAASYQPLNVLEIAAGSGAATRQLARALPANTSLIATDINQAMLDRAATIGTARPIEWRHADAMRLPFDDERFDIVVCQFGAMFFPDKATAFAEVRRVLRPGGRFVFNVWDRIEYNEFADAVTAALATLFPDDPPRFLARVPHGYHQRAVIEHDLESGGFGKAAEFTTLTARSRAKSPEIPAIAYCQGSPLRNEIEGRDASRLNEATAVAAETIAKRFGANEVDGKMQAHVIAVER